MASDYFYEGLVGPEWKHVYTRNDVSGAKKVNSEATLILEKPLSQFPTVLEMCRNGLEAFYGAGIVEKLEKQMEPRKGFLDV